MWMTGSESVHLQFFFDAFMVLALGAAACYSLLLWRSDGGLSRTSHFVIWALGITAVLAAIGFYFPFTNDDSFILFRYAENAAAGLGWVFNAGERVEGYTSPLWLAVATLGSWVGLDVALFTKVAGAAMALLSLLLFTLACRRVFADPLQTWMTVFMLAFSQLFLSWSGCATTHSNLR